MRWLNMLDAWLDMFDFTSAFQVAVLLLVMLKMFSLQTAERLDHMVDRVPLWYGWPRRAATLAESITWLWLVIYQYEQRLTPWSPMLFLVMANFAAAFSRFVIIYKDYRKSYTDEGKMLPPLKPR